MTAESPGWMHDTWRWPRALVLLLAVVVMICPAVSQMMSAESSRLLIEDMYRHAWTSYVEHAFPADELQPVACIPRLHRTRGAMDSIIANVSLTAVDALDSLLIFGYEDDFRRVVQHIIANVTFDKDLEVSTFEMNIRVLGGLISGHLLALASPKLLPEYKGELLVLAEDLGHRLARAFESPTGIPFTRVNLRRGVSRNAPRRTSVAEAGTYLMEFGMLTALTGNQTFYMLAKQSSIAIFYRRSSLGLVGSVVDVTSGAVMDGTSTIGPNCDSFYEYLLKAYFLFDDRELYDMFQPLAEAIDRHHRFEGFYFSTDAYRGTWLHQQVSPLAAFWGGTQVSLGDLLGASATAHYWYALWRIHGALPEGFDVESLRALTHLRDSPLRPELYETNYYVYQATKLPIHMTMAEEYAAQINNRSRVACGFASIKDVRKEGSHDERMDSYFLSETLVYLYLTVTPPAVIDQRLPFPLAHTVFTTEGHLFPAPRLIPHLLPNGTARFSTTNSSRADNHTDGGGGGEYGRGEQQVHPMGFHKFIVNLPPALVETRPVDKCPRVSFLDHESSAARNDVVWVPRAPTSALSRTTHTKCHHEMAFATVVIRPPVPLDGPNDFADDPSSPAPFALHVKGTATSGFTGAVPPFPVSQMYHVSGNHRVFCPFYPNPPLRKAREVRGSGVGDGACACRWCACNGEQDGGEEDGEGESCHVNETLPSHELVASCGHRLIDGDRLVLWDGGTGGGCVGCYCCRHGGATRGSARCQCENGLVAPMCHCRCLNRTESDADAMAVCGDTGEIRSVPLTSLAHLEVPLLPGVPSFLLDRRGPMMKGGDHRSQHHQHHHHHRHRQEPSSPDQGQEEHGSSYRSWMGSLQHRFAYCFEPPDVFDWFTWTITGTWRRDPRHNNHHGDRGDGYDDTSPVYSADEIEAVDWRLSVRAAQMCLANATRGGDGGGLWRGVRVGSVSQLPPDHTQGDEGLSIVRGRRSINTSRRRVTPGKGMGEFRFDSPSEATLAFGRPVVIADPSEACTPLQTTDDRPFAYLNKVVLIERGSCLFVDKISAAEDAGAAAVLIVNYPHRKAQVMTGPAAQPGVSGPQVHIPAIMISAEDGDTIRELVSSLGDFISVHLYAPPRQTSHILGQRRRAVRRRHAARSAANA